MSYEVKKRDNGMHFVEFNDSDGKRKRLSLGTRDEKAADQLARKKYIEFFSEPEDEEEKAPASRGVVLSLSEGIERMKKGAWHPDVARSWESIWSDARILLRYFGDVDVRDITAESLQGYADEMKAAGQSPGTIRKRLSRIKTLLLKCSSSWINPKTQRPYIPYVPEFPEGIAKQRIRKRELTEDQERSVYDYCAEQRVSSDRGQQWWLFAEFIKWQIDTGMRKGESLAKEFSDVKDQSVWLQDGETKNEEPREVPLTSRVQQTYTMLATISGGRGKIWAGLNFGKVQEMWSEVRRELGLGDLVIHDLRHTRGQRLADKGVPLEVIADLLGHKDVSVTAKIYTFRKSETLRKWTDYADEDVNTDNVVMIPRAQ